MELGLKEKYTIGIEVSFVFLILLSTIVVKLSYYLARKRQWTRCKNFYERVVLCSHYWICFFLLSATLIVPSSLGFFSPWISVIGVWVLLSVGFLNYNRQVAEEQFGQNFYSVEDSSFESMIPLAYSNVQDPEWVYFQTRGPQPKGCRVTRGGARYLQSIKRGAAKKPCRLLGGILLSLGISMGSWLLTDGMCITAHPVEISTWFSRQFQPNACEGGSICNVYFTLPEDPSTSIIVNYHSQDEPKRAFVKYSRVGSSELFTVEANWFKFEELTEVTRHIYWAEVSGLQPGTGYEFTPGYEDDSGSLIYSTGNYKVKTLPSEGNVTFVTGGDMQNDNNGIAMSKVAASHNPSFVLFGGDIAYANSDLHCYKRWDYWFYNWNKYMKDSLGFNIPISVTIGNHEAGGDRGRPKEEVKFYFEYFPQQIGLKNVPPKERPIYHAHQISNHTLALMLDSGLVEPMIGSQSIWLEDQLNKTNAVNKVAVYHYPMYPAVTIAKFMTPEEKQTWVDLFERYSLTVGFENHFHVFKEAKPIRDNQVNENEGVKYLGDGAWGIDGGLTFLNPDSWWIQSAFQIAHVYVVTASEHVFNVTAFSKDNQRITSYTKYHEQQRTPTMLTPLSN